jgi:hypothetical protein
MRRTNERASTVEEAREAVRAALLAIAELRRTVESIPEIREQVDRACTDPNEPRVEVCEHLAQAAQAIRAVRNMLE